MGRIACAAVLGCLLSMACSTQQAGMASTGPACTPTTCAAQGKNCGSAGGGCGRTLRGGSRSSGPALCGGGLANVCGTSGGGGSDAGSGGGSDAGSGGGGGCVATTCAQQGADCGTISDGCGSTLSCGSCGPGMSCGAGRPNVCAAPPRHPSETVWAADIPGSGSSRPFGLVADRDGNVITSINTDGVARLTKLDSSGRLVWQRPVGNVGWGKSLAVTLEGAIYYVAEGGTVVSKYGPDGTFWYSVNAPPGYRIAGIAADSAGGFATIIFQLFQTGPTHYAIDRRNAEGGIVWSRTLAFSGDISAWGLAFDPSGDVLVGGYVSGEAQFAERMPNGQQPPVRGRRGSNTPFIVKLSDSDTGWVKWVQTADSGANGNAHIIDVGTPAIGTAVGLGQMGWGTVSYAGSVLTENQGERGFLMVAEHDGAPRFLQKLSGTVMTALAVDPAGDAYALSACFRSVISVERWHLSGDQRWVRYFPCDNGNPWLSWAAFSPRGWPVFAGYFSGTIDFGNGPQRAQAKEDSVIL